MTRPDAGGYVVTDNPTIDLRALLSLSRLLHPGQPECDSGDDSERTLRAHEEAEHVVAGDVVDALTTELEYLAGTRDDLEAEDVIPP